MKVNTQASGNLYGAYKTTTKAAQHGTFTMNPTMNEDDNAFGMFMTLKEKMIEEHKLTNENIKNEDDWRYMSDDQWDKLLENYDNYIDDIKEKQEKIEELREEAVKKATIYAPAEMKAEAASKAALIATTNGIVGARVLDRDASILDKLSWTYDMQTEDQTILATAKMANEFAPYIVSKAQQLALIGDNKVDIREEDKEKKRQANLD